MLSRKVFTALSVRNPNISFANTSFGIDRNDLVVVVVVVVAGADAGALVNDDVEELRPASWSHIISDGKHFVITLQRCSIAAAISGNGDDDIRVLRRIWSEVLGVADPS